MHTGAETFLNPIALAVYALLVLSTALWTRRQARLSSAAHTPLRWALCFVATFSALGSAAIFLSIAFFILILSLGEGRFSFGGAFLFVILGPALCALLALTLAQCVGWLVSRACWKLFALQDQQRRSSASGRL